MCEEWLTDRSWEVIELSKFSFAYEQAPNREATFGIYSSTVSRGVDVCGSSSTCRCRTQLVNTFICGPGRTWVPGEKKLSPLISGNYYRCSIILHIVCAQNSPLCVHVSIPIVGGAQTWAFCVGARVLSRGKWRKSNYVHGPGVDAVIRQMHHQQRGEPAHAHARLPVHGAARVRGCVHAPHCADLGCASRKPLT